MGRRWNAFKRWVKGDYKGDGKFQWHDLISLGPIGANPKGSYKDLFGHPKGDQASSEDLTGLQLSDAFGDDIREMQQAAAQQQMAYQTQSAKDAMQFSADEAQKNRDWQEKMSNSSYTRAVSDLKNAGLNPVLAVGSNMGASTPAGSSAVGIAQSGAQAAVSEYNSALEVLSVLMSGITDIISSAKGLGTKRFKVGF